MKNKMPRVSIIIPVYNGENYVSKAIDSALNQTYKNVEVIVINDGSKDNTSAICKKYGDKIKYYEKDNGGVSSALNYGIKKMTGEYFSWLSHDDLYYSKKIEKQMGFISKVENKNTILYCDCETINERGKRIGKVIIPHDETIKKPEYALLRGYINGITLLIPKKAFIDCGDFDLDLKCSQDYDLWYKFMKKYEFVHMPIIITQTRIHALQGTQHNPKVIEEGTVLWKKLIESVSDQRKIELEGSLYNYYYEMAKFLITTPYKENFDYCVNKCISIDAEQYKKHKIKKSKVEKKSFFRKLIYFIRAHGPIGATKIIINRIFKRKSFINKKI